MQFFINFILPPLVGALIGYSTNKIAISMIFKPYTEIRIFKKIRVPFTPGLIPKERHELASNIGSMVENELLTADVISSKFQSDEVKAALQRFMSTAAEDAIPTAYEPGVHTLFGTLREESIFDKLCDKVEKEIGTYLNSLGGMAAMMISASGFDQKMTAMVPAKLLEILNEAEVSALTPENSAKMIALIQQKKEAIPFEKIADSISLKIGEEIQSVMKILNIKILVEEKINSLDIREVEKILLVIIKKHLKWINFFGAILGSLIGVIQVVLNLL